MRLFVFARHAESAANVGHVLSTDPSHPAALTRRGRAQARKLGTQIANLQIDLAFCTRFLRTRETVDLALRDRGIPVLVEPGLDEIQAGAFDGAPIQAYWSWKERHASSERFPGGESIDEAVRRYVGALQRLLARTEAVTVVIAHELALRYVTTATDPTTRATSVPNASPFLFDENALQRAAECLNALAPAAVEQHYVAAA